MAAYDELDLKKSLSDPQFIESYTNNAVNKLLDSINYLSNDFVKVEGDGTIFGCSITLNDLMDFDLDLDFFLRDRDYSNNYLLLEKIRLLRRLIVNINNIFISIISDLDCCSSDDKYNQMVVPIFKWLVEDENGLCGTLLRISKEIYNVYIPIKRILCIFRHIPGNPTLSVGGTDYLKYIYPMLEGLEKLTNMLNNGSFLDIILIPVKNFHDKLVACSNGTNLTTKDVNLKLIDTISKGLFEELTYSLITEIKSQEEETSDSASARPKEPQVPIYNFNKPVPVVKNFSTLYEYKVALYQWNEEFYVYKKDIDRQYQEDYSEFLIKLEQYRNDKFKETFNLNETKLENTSLTIDLYTSAMKEKYKPICGCLGEIFRLDGFFVPKQYIIKSEADLEGLIGEVEYKGIKSENYYFDADLNGKKRLKIIQKENLKDFLNYPVETYLEIKMENYLLDNKFNDIINDAETIQDVININKDLRELLSRQSHSLVIKQTELNSMDSVFYKKYQDELKKQNKIISSNKALLAQDSEYGSNFSKSSARYLNDIKRASTELTTLTSYPPLDWLKNPGSITIEYGVSQVSYQDVLDTADEIETLEDEIYQLNLAISKNHTLVKIVDNSVIECSCDLLCKLVQYIIGIIMSIIQKLINHIIQYMLRSMTNKELQWWLEFITSKLQCVMDILNISKELKSMEEKFNKEISAASGSIKKAYEYLEGCTASESLLQDKNLFNEKAKVNPDTIKDIDWDVNPYPEYISDTVDQTPDTKIIQDNFNLITKNVDFATDEWKNRTIPNLLLDCKKDHYVGIEWEPTSYIWSMYMNVTINIDQFNDSPNIILNGLTNQTEEELISNTYDSIIWNLLNTIHSNTDTTNYFNYRITYNGIDLDLNSMFTRLDNNDLISGNTKIDINEIDKLFIKIDDYIKVFDRTQADTLSTFYESYLSDINNIKESIESVEDIIIVAEENEVNKKPCGLKNLTINDFQALYIDKDINLYSGTIVKNETFIDGKLTNIYTYLPISNEDTTIIKPNVPFVLEIENNMGMITKIILLIDVCDPNDIHKTSYDKDRDGVFLGGRYDYFKFDIISNDKSKSWTTKEILDKLKPHFESIGLISSDYYGINLNNSNTIDENVISNSEDDTVYLDGFGPSDLTGTEILNSNSLSTNKDIRNLVASSEEKLDVIKETVKSLEQFINVMYSDMSEILQNNDLKIDDKNIEIVKRTIDFTQKDSNIGIPLVVLNDEANIILTIHKKKLKLININRGFGVFDPDIVVEQEIDYKAGENLFIEYSTNGASHTISWTNERKIKASASMSVFNQLKLKPTTIGSVYKNGLPVALLCGKINDLIFTNSNKDSDDWYNHSNSYKPDGTIGYYDFSLFDGYHVYSIPPYFRITTIEKMATVKGILYETADYTQAQINQMIQDGKYNELLKTQITIIGERPISVGGDFIWNNKKYYKNMSFGYLDNFFCRDNLKGHPFTISFWLKQKDSLSNGRSDSNKKYIIVDNHNGNFVWYEDGLLNIKLFDNPLRSEPCTLLFKENINDIDPKYVEKWFHHTFRYDKINSIVYYNIVCIDNKRNFDINYDQFILDNKEIKIPLVSREGRGKVLDFSLVSMLSRYDVKKLKYDEQFDCEISSLAIWNEFKDNNYLNNLRDYQRRIIQNEME